MFDGAPRYRTCPRVIATEDKLHVGYFCVYTGAVIGHIRDGLFKRKTLSVFVALAMDYNGDEGEFKINSCFLLS